METQMTSRNRNEKWRVLVVDDEEAARYGIRRALAGGGDYEIEEAGSVEEARAALVARSHDLMLLDVNLPGMSGLEYLRELSESEDDRKPLVVMVTAYGSERKAVEAIKTGAYDYLSKPFEIDDLRLVVNCAALPSELIESELFGHEKGAFTGAAARRRGKFEQADGGTLFLDEIGDMSANVQAKLLRALEERRIERLGGSDSIPVDVRIVSATHRPLEQEIEKGSFRADLFYRLQVVTVEIAPLRDRREDIPILAETFARQAAERYGLPPRVIAPTALRRLVEYNWPGNVRELRNAVERALILAEGNEVTARDLPEEIGGVSKATKEATVPVADPGALAVPFTSDFREDRREFERRYIARCLEETGGNVTRAASILGMHRQSLQHKLRELGLARRYVAVGGDEAQDISDN